MKRLGKQKPRFKFYLNPYLDERFTRCPQCGGKTKLRKLPLMIHVDPMNLFALNKTCRYCPDCDLLIAHQDELETNLATFFAKANPEVIGNDYLVVGTLDRPDWQKGVNSPISVQEMLDHLHDFRQVLKFEPMGGLVPEEQPTNATKRPAMPSGEARMAPSLLQKMQAHLPIPAYPTPQLVRALKERGLTARGDRPLSIDHVFDTGDLGGISCGMLPEPNAKEALVVSLTHLRIAPDHPLAREIETYQRERVRRIATTSQ